MPVEIKTFHNLRLGNYNLWEVYRNAGWAQITNRDFRFKKRILSQVFGEMACNGLYYRILTNYSVSWLKVNIIYTKTFFDLTEILKMARILG
ncbi:kinase-like domain-containing protein [Rhizophagus irregularis DAOM 181602=DAOM 197198]|nr:kinase-like domain-containing protein [Rhizophagus irregularis DAOM 181602=DAOM 197198]